VAYQTPPTTLTSLEFADIKTSLLQYLTKQSEFSGYEFEGSALSTLLDLMAYNSYYYAFYSNMIASEAFLDSAQRIESLISLCKPLGYTIPSKTAARARVIATGATNDVIPRYSIFYGYNADGTQYKFYNLEDVFVVDSQTEPFYIYEGKMLVDIEARTELDVERQRIVIIDSDFDLDTIEIRITDPSTSNADLWTRIDNIGYSNTIEEKIYFIERVETGFIISFGLINSVGKDVTADVTSIRVRYLKTNGSKGNDITLFSSTIGNVFTDGEASYGGRDQPSIDTIRFLAPKWFAAQERAVTVNDYKALIMEAGFFATENDFNVYGGEDIFPRRYGRVFVTSKSTASEMTDLMDFLKQRSVITVLPEYVNSVSLNIFVNIRFGFNDGIPRSAAQKQVYINGIKTLFAQRYGTSRRFNLNFSAVEFSEYVTSVYPEVSINSDGFNIFVEQEANATVSDFVFNLQNEIDVGVGDAKVISNAFSNTIDSVDGVYVIDNILGQPVVPLQVWDKTLTTILSANAGTVNVNSGYVSIKSGIMNSAVRFNIPFALKDIIIGLNNLVTFNIKEITTV